MNKLIACCGLDCEKCDARRATINNDDELRKKTAALWSKLNGAMITPEMINCFGCRSGEIKTPFCDKLCPIHNCVKEKGFDTCASCLEMNSCKILEKISKNNPTVLENLKRMNK